MTKVREIFDSIKPVLDKQVKGKELAKEVIFAAFLSQGNVLLEGVPGIAKTLLARTFARTLGLGFSRIQFTPDLMPSDILGTSIYNPGNRQFEFIQGPLFSDFILADEINRAPAKTQAALLEAMEERQATVDNRSYRMSENFIVFATQNPLEFEGTYALPEAQLDRFMVRILLDYPSDQEEQKILEDFRAEEFTAAATSGSALAEPLKEARLALQSIVVDEKIISYVRNLIRATRSLDQLMLGNSPRAGKMLLRISTAYAAIKGSTFVSPDHVRELAPFVLPHRWILKPDAEVREVTLESVLRDLFGSVAVPS